ncbi:hypothetical protein MJD09_08305 [bacterium]|nr:hypothetical protein [bacterium]
MNILYFAFHRACRRNQRSYLKGTRLAIITVLIQTLPNFAQDSNFLYPVADIEKMINYEPFEIIRIRGARFKEDLTKRAILKFENNRMMQVKWKRSEQGGWSKTDEPRYEIAAYQIQKLFLDPGEFVVPPTTVRAMTLEQYDRLEPEVKPTFKNTGCVVYVLQYWLENIDYEDIYNKKRFESDAAYARNLANMNILSYLIQHKSSNVGNFLISTDPQNPRVYAVDNGLAFEGPRGNRGDEWRKLRVKRLPAKAIERLRAITREALTRALGVVAQFEVSGDLLTLVGPTENLDPNKGVVHRSGIIQFGLTDFEIDRVERRLQKLLERVDSGKIEIF